jgi:biopolymer transport protein ExbB
VVPGVPLAERFAQGGWVMWPILALSVVTLTFTVERLLRLRRGQIMTPGFAAKARTLWNASDNAALIKASHEDKSVLGAAVEMLASHAHLPANEASSLVGDEVARLMRRHLQRAYPLAIASTLSPLLGLLGTVLGMIDSFEVVAIAGSLGDASLLAGGISKALITTAFGLIVAIPALGLYHHFRSKTHDLSLELEEVVNNLMGTWFYKKAAAPTATA